MYPTDLVLPMKLELTDHGFEDLQTAEQVKEILARKGTLLVMVNSVCGCSASGARPGTVMAVLNSEKKPDYIATTFAGYDIEAVQTLREHLLPIGPSSPAIFLFKDGKVVAFLERHHIEGRPAQLIAGTLIQFFEEHC